MPNKKTDEQVIGEYLPKIKAFTDTPIFSENTERVYNFLMSSGYDEGGWLLYNTAKSITNVNVYSAFPTEDNLGYFEELNGNGLLKWLTIAKFAKKEYEQLPGGYEKLKSFEIDKDTPEYKEYKTTLFLTAVHSIIDNLTKKNPQQLPGFWARLSNMDNILNNGLISKDDLNEILYSELYNLPDDAKEKAEGEEYSEYEVKSGILDALYTVPLTDEQIKAFLALPNILDEACEFYKYDGKDGLFFDAAFGFLYKTECEYLTGQLHTKAEADYDKYITEISRKPSDEIIREAYTINTLNEILSVINLGVPLFRVEQIKALLSLDEPLWHLFHKWQSNDYTLRDDMIYVIEETAIVQACKLRNIDYNPDLNNETEDGQEP